MKFSLTFDRAGARGLFAPFYTFLGLALALTTGMRIVLLAGFWEQTGSVSEFPRLFLTGLRFDLLFICYAMAPAWVAACLLPLPGGRWIRPALHAYFVGMLGFMTFLELAAWPSLREFGSRPEALFLEFLKYGKEVVSMIAAGFLLETVAATLAIAAMGVLAHRRLKAARSHPWPVWWLRLLLLPVGAAPIFLGARSSLGHRPANLSTASFSQNHFHNELALNSTYTLLYAAYRRTHETDTALDYGSLPVERIFELTKAQRPTPASGYLPLPDGRASTMHRQDPAVTRDGPPPNVVIILLESFGAEYTSRYSPGGLTPNFDRLAQEGITFDRMFATGTRTSRGIEAIMSSFFPTPARAVLKLGLAQRNFYTVAEMFRREGYSTHFVYGGEANFDEMKSFFVGNGVEHIWDQAVVQKPSHAVGVWGIHDEDLFLEGHEVFNRQKDQPFFGLILSTSNHTPFDYPEGRIEPNPDFPADSPENAIKYADYALGKFFEKAKASPYFQNTIFLVVADHGTRVSGDQLIPIFKFHIPATIVGPPHLVKPQVVNTLASQVDLMPTILGLTGKSWTHPMMGRDLLAPDTKPFNEQGRALLQYETHFGYWKGNNMVILRPGMPAAQFEVKSTTTPGRDRFQLEPKAEDPALVEEALAHSLLPSYLYRERLYQAKD